MSTEKRKKENFGFLRRRKMHAEYLQNRHKYPLPFEDYEIHHKDFNNKNFHTDNLQLLTPREHDRLHDEHNEGLRRKAEKIEEQLDRIKEIQKAKRKKQRRTKIISILIVSLLIGALIFIYSLTAKSSPSGELPALGYITIGKNYVYPEDISTMEKANETCSLRCMESFQSVVTNFPLHYITCYCQGKKYFVDTRTLEDLSSQEIAKREKSQ